MDFCQLTGDNHAALGSVPWSMDDPLRTNAVNVDGFINMLVAAKDARVKRFVYASSSAVYGDTPEYPQIEDRLGRPLSPYAASKTTNETYALAFQMSYGSEMPGVPASLTIATLAPCVNFSTNSAAREASLCSW